ncbi:hypothetical protein [Micromonospora humidisoli]|uniref:Uncharacterized protein n=1 Tax=Micromonospora humidisoli TaxID=2807622 RepID=A0ABS2J436_9ACTN|nr:hypothetical protein [Micromonospora humidisoli]MBM7081323.1 hypothetical protein [Micromonospora humidisoli]
MTHNDEVARWTHMWAAAAVHLSQQLESIWDDEMIATSIGTRDALSLVLVDAIRNVQRGAEKVCGKGSAAVSAFVASQPTLKDLRDRFEHFDAYVVGDGHGQRGNGQPPLILDVPSGIEVSASQSGGDGGHIIVVKVSERTGPREYLFSSRAATDAARVLARETVRAAGLLDWRHEEKCKTCPESLPQPRIATQK